MLKKVLLASLVFALALVMSACSDKPVITESDFVKIAEEAGYSIIDAAARFDTGEYTAATQALESGEKFSIEFYVFPTTEKASEIFKELKKDVKAIGTVWSQVENNAANYNIFRGTNNDVYYVISRIGETLIYTSTGEENKDAVNELLDKLGYK